MNTQTPHLSGFAKKKALEAVGYTVEKLHNPDADMDEWCVIDGACDGSQIIASDRLQGVAVNKAIDLVGGL